MSDKSKVIKINSKIIVGDVKKSLSGISNLKPTQGGTQQSNNSSGNNKPPSDKK